MANIFDTPTASTAPSQSSGNIFDTPTTTPTTPAAPVASTPQSPDVKNAVEGFFSKVGGVLKTAGGDLVSDFTKPAINPDVEGTTASPITSESLSAPSQTTPANSLQNYLAGLKLPDAIVKNPITDVIGGAADDFEDKGQAFLSSLDNSPNPVVSHAPNAMTEFDRYPDGAPAIEYDTPEGKALLEKEGTPVDAMGNPVNNNTPLTRIANGMEAAVSLTNFLFSPISALFKTGEQVPVVKYPLEGVDYGFSKIGQGVSYITNNIVNKLPISQASKDTIQKPIADVASLIAQIYAGDLAIEKGVPLIKDKLSGIQTTLTKDITETHAPGKTVFINPDQVRDILSGRLTEGEEKDLYLSLGRSVDQIKGDLKTGTTIEVPASKITTLADKPYWAKIKGIFGVESKPEINISGGGNAQEAKRGLPELTSPKDVINSIAENIKAGKPAIESSDPKITIPKEDISTIGQTFEQKTTNPDLVPQSDNIKTTDAFKTLDMGDLEGTQENKNSQAINKQRIAAGNVPMGNNGTGETFNQFQARVLPEFNKILNSAQDGTTIVTHSSVLKLMQEWEAEGRPANLKVDADKYNKLETKPGDVETFKGKNGDIHVVRHGQTEDNVQSNFRSPNTNLTQQGVEQAHKAGREVSKKLKGNPIPQIISSILPRTIHTSNILNEEATGGANRTKYDTPEVINTRHTIRDVKPTSEITTPERDQLRRSITDKVYGIGAEVRGHRMDIVTGGAGSRKSSLIAEPLAKEHGSLITDSDIVKKELPEHGKEIGSASAIHRESSVINKDVLIRAIKNGDNIVFPTVGADEQSLKKIIDIAHSNGYEIHLHHAELDPDVAIPSTIERFNEGKQGFIDPSRSLEGHLLSNKVNGIVKSYDKLSSQTRYSTDVGKGEKPEIVDYSRNQGLANESGRMDEGRGTEVPGHLGGEDNGGRLRERTKIDRKALQERAAQLERVNEYKDRLKLRGADPVLVDAIITPRGTRAYGASVGGNITLERVVEDFTEDHEVFHQVFQNMDKMRVFKNFDKAELISEAKDLYGDLTEPQLEEEMAKDFQQYVNEQENGKSTSFFGKIAEFFQKLFSSIKRIFKNKNDINEFYRTVYSDRATQETEISNEMPKAFEQQVKDGLVDFRIQNATANFLDEVPVKDAFTDSGDLTLKTIQKLQGRTTVSKQYIYDLTNSGDIKQVERDLIRSVLDSLPDDQKVDVAQFAQDVKDELLPLNRRSAGDAYEPVTLPDNLRGDIDRYEAFIYNSPIKTSAGNIHFGDKGEPSKNYFGHTRVEDIITGEQGESNTRRVIEVQSDLYQKGRLDREQSQYNESVSTIEAIDKDIARINKRADKLEADGFDEIADNERAGVTSLENEKARRQGIIKKEVGKLKLSQYNDPTAHFRMVREEIRKAAQDGKTKLQFPTGETAMKIEGLDGDHQWFSNEKNSEGIYPRIQPRDLKVGENIRQNFDQWIITDVLGDGKFKAVAKNQFPEWQLDEMRSEFNGETDMPGITAARMHQMEETFDISGKVDTSNPIYRFYEKDLGRYLKNNYNAVPVTDDKGVTWMEVPIQKAYGDLPVPAFNEHKEGQSIEQLQNQRERFKQSLDAYKENPQAHIQAYGEDRSQFYKDKIDQITKRIQEIRNPKFDTGNKLDNLRAVLQHTEERVGAETLSSRTQQIKEKLQAITPDAQIPKIHVAGKDVQIPENLSRRQLGLEIDREQLNNSPYKELLQYVPKVGGLRGTLPEVLGKKNLEGTSYSKVTNPKTLQFIQDGDQIIQEIFGKNMDTEEVRSGMETYLKNISDAKTEATNLRKDLSNYIKEEKDNISMDRISHRQLTDQEKIDQKKKEAESLANWKSLFKEYAHEAGLPQSISEVEPPKVRGGISAPELHFPKWKDIGTFRLARDTFERNLEKVATPADANALKKFIVEPVRKNELDRVEFNNKLKLDTKAKIKELGIKRNSLSDELVQKWGEGLLSPEELKRLAPKNYQDIQKASEYFRNQYDMLIDKWNAVRREYGYPEVPKRKDYFRHFDEINFFTKTYGFLQSKDELPTEIAGKTEFFKPGKTFSTAEMKRVGKDTKYSAIGGFNNYIDSVSKQMFHINSIQRGRALERYIEKAAQTGRRLGEPLQLSNFIANLREYINNGLAGKTATIDRAIEGNLGRTGLQAFDRISKLIGKNIIVGNVSTALSHLVSIPLIASTTNKIPLTKGLMTTLTSPLQSDPFTTIDGQKSSYLTRRFPIDEISPTMPKNIENALSFLFIATDKFKSQWAVSGKYYEGIGDGLSPEDAMKQADIYAGKTLGDYSLGQKPNLMNSKTLGLIAQFQLGVNDSMSVLLHDVPESEKTEKEDSYGNPYTTTNKWAVASKLIQFAIFSYLFNLVIKDIKGSGKGLDPIDLGLTLAGLNTEGKGQTPLKRAGLAGKDVLGELPFTSAVTGNFPLATALSQPVKDLAAGNYAKAAEGVAANFASPVGGGAQFKKSVEGAQSIQKGESVGTGQNIKSLIFGASTAVTPNAAISLKLNTKAKTAQTKLSGYDPSTIARVQKVYDQAKAAGFGTPAADALVSPLSDYDYKVYNAIKSADNAQQNIALESKVLPIVEQAQKLGFGTPAADKLISDSFPNTPEGDEEYTAYQSVKASLTLKTPPGTVGNNKDGTAIFEGHPTYYTGQTGPVAEDILGGNPDDGKIAGKNPNGEPLYVRDSKLETSRKAEMYKADPYWKDNGYALGDTQFDHIIPLEAGGTNTANNIQLISKVADEGNQNFEDYLGAQYKAGAISRADAAKASIDYKINKTVTLKDVEGGKF